MSTIPVICNNQICRAVWFVDDAIEIEPGASATIRNCTASPCPRCGGSGSTPDGIYKHSSISYFDKNQLTIVLYALDQLRSMASNGASQEGIRKEIGQRFPFLKSLEKYLPKDSASLAAWVAIVLSIMTTCSATQQTQRDSSRPFLVPVSNHEVLEAIHGDLLDYQASNTGNLAL